MNRRTFLLASLRTVSPAALEPAIPYVAGLIQPPYDLLRDYPKQAGEIQRLMFKGYLVILFPDCYIAISQTPI